MNKLPQDSITIMRSYDRNPCGDMMSNSKSERFDNAIMIKTQKKRIPNNSWTLQDFRNPPQEPAL